MSGVSFNSTSYSTRLNEIESALMNPKSNKVVNDKLEVVKKDNGFLRFLKIMVLPLARFFGADPFGHTRAHKVATALLAEYQKLEDELSSEDKNRLSRIVTKLDQKTKQRYHKVMNVFINMIPVDPSIATPVFTSTTKSLAVTPPPPPMGKDGKPLPPPPMTFTSPKDPMQALKKQIAKNKGETGDTEEADTKTTEVQPQTKPDNPAAELANLFKGGGIDGILKKAQQNKKESEEDKGSVETGTSGEVNPWAKFGAKKNEGTTTV